VVGRSAVLIDNISWPAGGPNVDTRRRRRASGSATRSAGCPGFPGARSRSRASCSAAARRCQTASSSPAATAPSACELRLVRALALSASGRSVVPPERGQPEDEPPSREGGGGSLRQARQPNPFCSICRHMSSCSVSGSPRICFSLIASIRSSMPAKSSGATSARSACASPNLMLRSWQAPRTAPLPSRAAPAGCDELAAGRRGRGLAVSANSEIFRRRMRLRASRPRYALGEGHAAGVRA
jgi:hypothetical protein